MAGLRFRRADPLTQADPTRTKFSNFPPKSKDQTYTLFDIRANANNINPTDKMNIMLTLVGLPQGANHELLEVYSNPQTGPLPGPPGRYLSRLSAHKFNQIKQLSLLFQQTSTVECRNCVVYAQDNNSLPVWSYNLSPAY